MYKEMFKKKIYKSKDIFDLTLFLNYISGKIEKKEYKDFNINILQDFFNEPTIINNKQNLISLIDELATQLELGNNILIPFLDIFPNLIKSYINSDLDEGKELKYIKIFNLLKINSFINRENLYPIYEYFSDIYYDMKIIKDGDERLTKFNKVFELWKIFYDFDIRSEEIKDFNKSSICLLGAGLQVKSINEINFNNDLTLKITINFLDFLKFYKNNNNLILLSIDDKNYDINFNEMKNLDSIILLLKKNKIIINIKFNNNVIYSKEENIIINCVKDFFILKNFYGQIINIKITCKVKSTVLLLN
jgi:hypothetical protein